MDVIHEYEEIAKRKGERLNLIIWLFTASTVLYAIGVGLVENPVPAKFLYQIKWC
jgi:hypothetical protein